MEMYGSQQLVEYTLVVGFVRQFFLMIVIFDIILLPQAKEFNYLWILFIKSGKVECETNWQFYAVSIVMLVL